MPPTAGVSRTTITSARIAPQITSGWSDSSFQKLGCRGRAARTLNTRTIARLLAGHSRRTQREQTAGPVGLDSPRLPAVRWASPA